MINAAGREQRAVGQGNRGKYGASTTGSICQVADLAARTTDTQRDIERWVVNGEILVIGHGESGRRYCPNSIKAEVDRRKASELQSLGLRHQRRKELTRPPIDFIGRGRPSPSQ